MRIFLRMNLGAICHAARAIRSCRFVYFIFCLFAVRADAAELNCVQNVLSPTAGIEINAHVPDDGIVQSLRVLGFEQLLAEEPELKPDPHYRPRRDNGFARYSFSTGWGNGLIEYGLLLPPRFMLVRLGDPFEAKLLTDIADSRTSTHLMCNLK